jgi:hypothetical protein
VEVLYFEHDFIFMYFIIKVNVKFKLLYTSLETLCQIILMHGDEAKSFTISCVLDAIDSGDSIYHSVPTQSKVFFVFT